MITCTGGYQGHGHEDCEWPSKWLHFAMMRLGGEGGI